MDLNTISRKLRDEKYRTVENVLDDIQLIFDNCKVYNAPGSVIFLYKYSGSTIYLINLKNHSSK